MERIFLSLKRAEVWPSDYENVTQTLAAVGHWVDDYNRERPHQALKNRTPHEVRREALESTLSAARHINAGRDHYDHEICILTADFHMATDMSYDDNALVVEM